MTLILTVISRRRVFQVSDRRLTQANGRLFDDHSNKSVYVECANGRFAIAYTGLAYINANRVDRWLFDVLGSMKASTMTVPEISDKLQERLTEEFGRSWGRSLGDSRRLSLVLTGVLGRLPFIAVLSNFEDASGTHDTPWDVFALRVICPTNPRQERRWFYFLVSGYSPAFTGEARRLVRQLRKHRVFAEADVNKVFGHLVRLTRAAADEPTAHGVIGRDCMAVALDADGQMWSEYQPDGLPTKACAPYMIVAGARLRDLQLVMENGAYTGFKVWVEKA